MKLNVLKQASLPDALTAELARRYHLVELTALTDADFRALAGTFTVLITNGEASVTRELIASLPALELIAVFGVGYDGVDVQAAAEHRAGQPYAGGVNRRCGGSGAGPDAGDLAADRRRPQVYRSGRVGGGRFSVDAKSLRFAGRHRGHGAHRPGHRPALRGVRHADCLS